VTATPEPLASLQDAIRNLHACEGVWVESVHVAEVFESETVWEGEVQVFDLPNCGAGSRCYAWSHAIEGSDRRRVFAVLHNRQSWARRMRPSRRRSSASTRARCDFVRFQAEHDASGSAIDKLVLGIHL